MGQSQSSQPPHEVPIEHLSHELALRFASKCYSHLEIAHFKDNFKSLADHTDDIEFWKEDTLCRFLCLPESLRAGPVLGQMCAYLGAFPFPSLAPSILTREAMLKVVTILTGRYRKVLKRGGKDKAKLLFRSLAVFDRRASTISSPSEKVSMKDIVQQQKPDEVIEEEEAGKEGRPSHAAGFAIDEPANDDEDEDEDDLALAALDALDAIEVFKQDQKVDRKINHAIIPSDNFKKLVMLLLMLGGIDAQSNLSQYADNLDEAKVKALDAAASAIVTAFDPEPSSSGIRYPDFMRVLTTIVPDLFEPLNPLFEHFMFSKNINLSKHKREVAASLPLSTAEISPIRASTSGTLTILNDINLSQLATSLHILPPSLPLTNIYASQARFHPIYSTSTNGTSLSSFSRQIQSWSGSSLLLISGSIPGASQPLILGAYLPQQWPSSSSSSTSSSDAPSALFQLSPRHAVFPANTFNHTPMASFSQKTGIAIGCITPTQSRTNTTPLPPILGPVSLLIDADMETATFQHDADLGQGAFVVDVALAQAQAKYATASKEESNGTKQSYVQPKKILFDIDGLEVWGITFPDPSGEGEDEIMKQQRELKWEEAEAARRRGVNFGGDKDGARALLEMAGLVGEKSGQGRSGGSV